MTGSVVVLTGGIGGAKLALGLAHCLEPGRLTAIVNTGDDFTHLGLNISPDIDTLLYTLSGRADTNKGWGRANETWNFMSAVADLGGPGWFALGDKDLAIHLLRTSWLAGGLTLSAATAKLASRLGIAAQIVPMSDDPVETRVITADGTELEFQHYFVKHRCAPVVAGIYFSGAASAKPAAAALEALADPSLSAILIAPSNPFLSVDPILAVPGMKEALKSASAPIVAVSPLVAGEAVKGPTAKLMRELGLEVSAQTVADHYAEIIDAMLIDVRDKTDLTGVARARADTLMNTLPDKMRVARAALALTETLQ